MRRKEGAVWGGGAERESSRKDGTGNRVVPRGMMGKQAAPTEDYMTRSCVDDATSTGVSLLLGKKLSLSQFGITAIYLDFFHESIRF